MSHFEYVMTGVSFLVAIMISRVIATLAMVRMRDVDFRHVAWLVVLIFHLMLFWWFGWRYREMAFTVHTYFAQIVPTLVLLFAVTILTPRESPNDWSSFFDSCGAKFLMWYLGFWLLLSITQSFLFGEIRPSIAPIVLCMIGLFFKSTIVQRSIPILMGISFLIIGFVLPESL